MYKGKSILVYLLVVASMLSYSQNPIVNKFRDSTWFAKGVRFDSTLVFTKGAGNGKVWTSNNSGVGSWQTFSSSGVSQGTLNDSISSVRSIRKVDTLYRNLDSLIFKINGIRYSVLDSTGGEVTQSALNDSIARIDSTINAIPAPLLTLTDDSLNISGGNTIELPYIPITGTRPLKPVTGDIEITEMVSIKNGIRTIMFTDENSIALTVQDTSSTQKGSINIGLSSISTSVNDAGNEASLELITEYFKYASTNPMSKGFSGQQDFTANIDSLDYTQKKYVDQRISDTATQIRSEIPDVSNFATITNLADTSALLRGLIPNTPTFSLSKNTTRDSIVTTYNGTRSAVFDSSVVLTNYITTTSTSTLTNKRITARVDSTTSSATPTINTDNVDTYKLTAQAVDVTSFTTNLTGTPTDDQILHIVIIGTAARAITWGSKFEASTVSLPTTTVSTNRLDVYFIWNTATSKWRCGGVW